jgi:hypothetical protein
MISRKMICSASSLVTDLRDMFFLRRMLVS